MKKNAPPSEKGRRQRQQDRDVAAECRKLRKLKKELIAERDMFRGAVMKLMTDKSRRALNQKNLRDLVAREPTLRQFVENLKAEAGWSKAGRSK